MGAQSRVRVFLEGIVQGVGMRPHVARIAQRFGLTGLVGNNERGVFIEFQGDATALHNAQKTLIDELPPLAHILDSQTSSLPLVYGETGFRIVESEHVEGEKTLISPDMTTCEACLADIDDQDNRRYHYPFTTCTHCGPRLSIITSLPYDRATTTMREFPMCTQCEEEYTNPDDRRFHAQPISCPHCGPTLWCTDANGAVLAETRTDALALDPGKFDELVLKVQNAWESGAVVAVKGIGGFHLMCAAENEEAVEKLRERKRRPDKPLAVMVPNLDAAKSIATLSKEAEDLLASPSHPIVSVPLHEGALCEGIAPGLREVGLMLPYSPLHHLLVDRPVVATSGNLSGEPLCVTNEEALRKLTHLADMFVLHDREIYVPVEDSVYVDTTLVRRSRGLAPIPMLLDTERKPTVLAVGGELKNTATLAVGRYAHVSSHVGDMGSWDAQRHFEKMVKQLCSIQGAQPDVVVCDMHPGYQTSMWAQRYADQRDVELIEVQHHHAHALSLLAEHQRLSTPAVVAALDGTGYGTDGTIWGGEILHVSDDGNAERLWHLPPFSLVGGDKAVRNPWRIARGLAYSWQLEGLSVPPEVDLDELRLVDSQLSSGFGTTATTSMGRLFDAFASILQVQQSVSYEAQAAMELEALAGKSRLSLAEALDATEDIRSFPHLAQWVINATLDGTRLFEDIARIAHAGIATLVARSLIDAAQEEATEVIGITGGCAVNRILMTDILQVFRHQRPSLTVLTHKKVPATDGGLSLGQAAAGRLWSR